MMKRELSGFFLGQDFPGKCLSPWIPYTPSGSPLNECLAPGPLSQVLRTNLTHAGGGRPLPSSLGSLETFWSLSHLLPRFSSEWVHLLLPTNLPGMDLEELRPRQTENFSKVQFCLSVFYSLSINSYCINALNMVKKLA